MSEQQVYPEHFDKLSVNLPKGWKTHLVDIYLLWCHSEQSEESN